jgi:hypothetical protein
VKPDLFTRNVFFATNCGLSSFAKFHRLEYYKTLQKILGIKMSIGRHCHAKASANSIAHANDKELDLRRT